MFSPSFSRPRYSVKSFSIIFQSVISRLLILRDFVCHFQAMYFQSPPVFNGTVFCIIKSSTFFHKCTELQVNAVIFSYQCCAGLKCQFSTEAFGTGAKIAEKWMNLTITNNSEFCGILFKCFSIIHSTSFCK